MMKLTAANTTGGYLMKSMEFHDKHELTGAVEYMRFEVRRAKGCVELHIVHVTARPGKRTSSRYMLHSYTPEAFEALKALISAVPSGEPEPYPGGRGSCSAH